MDSIESFQNFAWIPVWDDHEVGDNTYRDGMADQNNTEDSFIQYGIEYGGEYISFDQRKMNAVRAVSGDVALSQTCEVNIEADI